MRTGKNEREGESERKTCERGFMSVCSAVILIMAPDSRVQYSEARAGRQQAGTVSTKSRFNMQNFIQLKNAERSASQRR